MKIFSGVAGLLLLLSGPPILADTPWDAEYFPNVPLTTHRGETVHFFDDLIDDKVVVINFIYTVCPDTCPLETARLAKVQELLGDRVGDDIFMYSITIDPENDTPEVLAQYAERYRAGPGWTFLTGDEADITLLRQKLGLYIEEIQDGSNNHNLNLIIGNQATGQWMKRSPFENPYVLATQIGSWLTGWKAPPRALLDYAAAPKVRDISQGEHLFRTRCSTCHTIGNGEEGLPEGLRGPDLLDVTQRREPAWLERWIAEPDVMLEERDPIAMGLYAKYDELPMPNMRLSPVDVEDLIRFIDSEGRRVRMQRAREKNRQRDTVALASHSAVKTRAGSTAQPTAPAGDVVAVMNAWVREAHPDAKAHGGYMTLINVGAEEVTLIALASPQYEEVEMHEMAHENGMMRMRERSQIVIPGGGQARFEPGGQHLMLKSPKVALVSGEPVELTLTFLSGRKQAVTVKVEDR
ncbi:MAG: copper chaperone PCu(A)C [Acidobacteriota bacterium]